MAPLLLSSIPSFSSNPILLPNVIKNRTRKLEMKCNAKFNGGENPSKDKGNGQLDRRNLLLGLGGLYGSVNLDLPAFAAPISDPDFSECHTARDPFNDQVLYEDAKCCPPISPTKPIDYELPEVKDMRCRRAAHLVDEEYITKYETAIKMMKDLPDHDPRNFNQQANVHCTYCNLAYNQTDDPDSKLLQIHFSWLFFPWHRWYLYFYERILAELIKDPTFALPFWNWDHPDAMYMPPMFLRESSQLSDAKRDPKHARQDAVVDLSYAGTDKDVDSDTIKSGNLKLMNTEMFTGPNIDDFYGGRYVIGTEASPGRAGSIENGSHTAIHRWVGDPKELRNEDMGNFYSAGRDPIFFSHHANVDRLWTIWCDLRKKEGLSWYFTKPLNGGPIDKDWGDASFLFYDENKRLVRVRVKDTLDNKRMGYDFQRRDLPWLEKQPNQDLTDDAKLRRYARKVPKQRRRKVAAQEFPATLKETVTVTLNRPAKSDGEEYLVIKDIEVDAAKFVRFEVYVNCSSEYPEILDKEYVGCYSQLSHLNAGKIKSNRKLRLTEVLKDLGAQDMEKISVSLVPISGGEEVTIGGVKIALLTGDEE